MRRRFVLLAVWLGGALAALAVAAWLLVGALARVADSKTVEVRKRIERDWRARQPELALAMASLRSFEAPRDAASPTDLGCRLPWTPADRPSVATHERRCEGRVLRLDEATVERLGMVEDGLLEWAATAPARTTDLTWMRALRSAGAWRWEVGTPREFEAPNPWTNPSIEWPTLDARQVQAIATLRLVQGAVERDVASAVENAEALARALLNSPDLFTQMLGTGVLSRQRKLLDLLGVEDLGTAAPKIESLRKGAWASAMLWHPWVPPEIREALEQHTHRAGRCAAAWEASIVQVDYRVLLQERYADYFSQFAARRERPDWCDDPQLRAYWSEGDRMTDGAWGRIARPPAKVGNLARAARVSRAAREALGDIVLSIGTPAVVQTRAEP